VSRGVRVKTAWPIRLALLFAILSHGARGDPPLPGSMPEIEFQGRATASYGVGPGFSDGDSSGMGPFGSAATSVGGSTFDVNAFVGADRYYGHTIPITGQNTITTNLEAGHFWNGHETLQHVATNTTNFVAGAQSWGGASISAKYDAHATWAAMLIGGRQTVIDPEIRQLGIAPGTSLRSAAIASEWLGNAYSTGFDFTLESFLIPYQATFGVADVVNSSWGFGGDSPGVEPLTVVMDAYAYQRPTTTYVVSAGNFGVAADTVVSPGSGYNAITVAALGGANDFDTVAAFSSRGPVDFGYLEGGGGPAVVVAGVRAAIDIAAPGTSLVSALYGGQTGGNNTSLANSLNYGSIPDAYSGVQGTSFASPIVAGGAALVASAAKTLPSLSSNPDATQSVVVKALLLNGAEKTAGWNNGQQQVTVGSDTYIRTTQSLDWGVGAGRMNLDTTFDLQLNGQTDVAGTGTGDLGSVVKTGWDYGSTLVGVANDYIIGDWLRGGTTFTAALAWMRSRFFDFNLLQYADVAQADLNLSVWELDESNQFTTLIARSESLYNTVEHLSFNLPRSGFYGLRVEYPLNTFDNTTDDAWGTAAFPQDYGLSWQAVPEPTGVIIAAAAAGLWPLLRRGGSTRRS
jgi:hypothetical protein